MNSFRVAAKQLTATDLTLFWEHFHRPDQRSKQKAINLNADVFVDEFYPALRRHSREVVFSLEIVGPGGGPPHRLSRKATRSGGKNWRLNGELIRDPAGEPSKYTPLAPGDYAILAFEGETLPEVVRLVLVSHSLDAALHSVVGALMSAGDGRSMVALSPSQVDQIVAESAGAYRAAHPLSSVAAADSPVAALIGSGASQRETSASDGRGAALTQDSIRRQSETAAETGQLGELTFASWLAALGMAEDAYEWVSKTHAHASYDFLLDSAPWESSPGPFFIDVKTTSGEHSAAFFMSFAELKWAASHEQYRIVRLSRIGEPTAHLEILSGIHELARAGIAALQGACPKGLEPVSFEVDPAHLSRLWKDEYPTGTE